MGNEQPASYYNDNLKAFLAPYEDSKWRAVYDAAVALMPADKSIRICDVGCGTGRLAEALRRAGYTNYVGYDFAESRIAEARRYMPDVDFRLLSVFDPAAAELHAEADVSCITEVLEHIDGDLALLESIPPGKIVVGSVPNFLDTAHVRKFRDVASITERYGALLNVDTASVAAIPSPNKPELLTFVFSGRRTSEVRHREAAGDRPA